jgi:hypothetical protein
MIINACFRGRGFDGKSQMGNISEDGLRANEQNSNNPEMALIKIACVYFGFFLMTEQAQMVFFCVDDYVPSGSIPTNFSIIRIINCSYAVPFVISCALNAL